FGSLTKKLLNNLENQGSTINYHHDVEDLKQVADGVWEVKVRNNRDGAIEYHTAKHVFIGAGGGALPLLQKTNIPQSKHVGGFPVSGLFLVAKNPEVVEKHTEKYMVKQQLVPHQCLYHT